MLRTTHKPSKKCLKCFKTELDEILFQLLDDFRLLGNGWGLSGSDVMD